MSDQEQGEWLNDWRVIHRGRVVLRSNMPPPAEEIPPGATVQRAWRAFGPIDYARSRREEWRAVG